MRCQAKIRPLPNDTELQCDELTGKPHTQHASVLRDYAYPGSATRIVWQEDDRRTFRGDWGECPVKGCTLPVGHPRGHAF